MKKYPILFIALLGFCFAPQAHAAISFDASSSKAFTGVQTVTSTITVGSGSNEMLAIIFALSSQPTAVKVDGNNANFAVATDAGAAIYYVTGLSAGSHSVSSTFSVNANGDIGLESLFGVNQSTPLDATSTNNGTSNSPSVGVTTFVANDWVLDATEYATTRTSTAAGAGQVFVFRDVGTTRALTSSYLVTTSTQNYNSSYTLSASVAWNDMQAAFEPAATVSSAPTPYDRLITMDW